MYNRIKKFNEYKDIAINEGLIDKAKELGSKIINKLGGFFNLIKEWIKPKKITSGPKKGAMTINYIDTSGDVLKALDEAYAGTDYVNTNRLKTSAIKENLNIREIKKLFEAETWRDYPTDGVLEAPQNIDAKQFKYILKMQYHDAKKGAARKSTPPFIFGAPGIGKTQIVAQVAKELGIGLIVFEVQNMDVSDFKGLGTPATYLDDETLKNRGVKNKDSLVYLRDESLFPDKDSAGEGGIIFMDEFPNADEDVIKKLNIFIESGTIDSSYKIPDNWIIVGAGNRPGDQEDIYDFQYNLPAAGRWKFFHFTPKASDWVDWARDNNKKYKEGEKIKTIVNTSKGKEAIEKERTYILPDVIDLVELYEDIFYNLDTEINPLSHASPRNWEKFSIDIKNACEIEGVNIDDWFELPKSTIDMLATSHVGKKAKNILMSYVDIRRYFDTNAIIKVFKNPEEAPYMKSINPNETGGDPSKLLSLINIMEKVFDKYTNNDEEKMINAYINILNYLLRYEAGEYVGTAINVFQNKYPEVLNVFNKTGEDVEKEIYQKLIKEIKNINVKINKINKQ